MSKLDEILTKLSQYRDETARDGEYLSVPDAKIQIKALMLELIGKDDTSNETQFDVRYAIQQGYNLRGKHCRERMELLI